MENLSKEFEIILVGTKIDTSQAIANEKESEKMIQELLSNRIVSDIQFISGKTHKNMNQLEKKILQHTNSILSKKEEIYLPTIYKLVVTEISEFHDLGHFTISVKELFWLHLTDSPQNCLSYLHDIGIIIYKKNSSKVCINPPLLSKAMALFIFPDEHKNILFPQNIKNSDHFLKKSILSIESIEHRLKLLLKDISSNLISEILECFQQLEFCFELTKKEEILYNCNESQTNESKFFLFPSLRPKGTFQLIENTNSSLPTIVCNIFNNSPFKFIGSNFFFQLECHLRNIHDPSTQLYSNGFKLQNNYSIAILLLSPNSSSIQVIIQSTTTTSSPSLFWQEIWQGIQDVSTNNFKGLSLLFDYLCPSCLLELLLQHSQMIQKFDQLPSSFIEDDSFNSSVLSKMQDSDQRSCNSGHLLSKKEITCLTDNQILYSSKDSV